MRDDADIANQCRMVRARARLAGSGPQGTSVQMKNPITIAMMQSAIAAVEAQPSQ